MRSSNEARKAHNFFLTLQKFIEPYFCIKLIISLIAFV